MKRKLALLLIAALIIIPFTSAFALNSMEEQVRDYLEEMTNDFRWNKGLQRMRIDLDLQAFAQEWADHMRNTNILVHRPSSERRAFMTEHDYTSIGENIVQLQTSHNAKEIAEEMMKAWMASPDHYANLTSPEYNVMGIGVAQDGRTYYACHNFGCDPKITGGVVTPEIPTGDYLPDTGEKPIPGLNYSETPVGDEGTKRAIVGPHFVIEGRNDALNGAAKIKVRQTGKNSYRYTLVDQAGNEVHTKGLVKVYMDIDPSIKRPFKVTMGGKIMQFADVEGTNYVWFVTEK